MIKYFSLEPIKYYLFIYFYSGILVVSFIVEAEMLVAEIKTFVSSQRFEIYYKFMTNNVQEGLSLFLLQM
jgi:hypothetical protein